MERFLPASWLVGLAAVLLVLAGCDDGEGGACGDGVIDPGEACDDGNDDDTDTCLTTCERASCGDGFVLDGAEECDDGNDIDYDDCTNDCREPRCGDGVLQEGEACDDGDLDDNDSCLGTCEVATCGDGFVREGLEGCDDGNDDDTDGCSNECRLPSCGDSVVQPPEACDDGNDDDTDGCLSTCQEAFCGDGVVRTGFEQCDDGNSIEDDGCTTSCELPGCGDGVVDVGEECDDGDGDDGDECLNTCQLARCGDGRLWVGREACDDGNLRDSDACASECRLAECGDGYLWAGVEGCDDGNDDDTDACLSTCVSATCGDGDVQEEVEECDDANVDNTDGCLMNCTAYDWCEDFEVTGLEPDVACVGSAPDQIVIEGTSFAVIEGVAPEVTFNGEAVEVVDLTGCTRLAGVFVEAELCTSMTVALPGGLDVGTYEVVVTLPVTQGCSDSAIFSIGPPPDITAVTPVVTCEGDNAFGITGSGFTPTTSVFFDGVAVTEVTYIDENNLSVFIEDMAPGDYDVTVSNGAGCDDTLVDAVTVLPNPRIFFVDPPVLYNGIAIQVTIYVSGINGGDVAFVGARPTGTAVELTELEFTYDPTRPNRVLATVPAGLAPGSWELHLEDALGCTAELEEAFEVTDSLTLDLVAIDPPFGWTSERTGVTLFAGDPPAAGMSGFVSLPRAYLNPATPGPDDLATALSAVGFVDETEITAVVPSGLAVGSYDVIVVNPDGSVGVIEDGFTITADPPPVIDDIAPGSVPNASAAQVFVYGQAFNDPTVELDCRGPSGTTTTYPVTVSGWTATELDTTVPANEILEGSVCVVRVTNPDGSYGEYSALGVTNPAENIEPTVLVGDLITGRRAPVAVVGRATRAATFLYVIGGDDGAASGAMASVEAAPLNRYGDLGSFRELPASLPAPRTLAAARVVDRFIYMVGGNDGSGPVATVLRAEVLDPADSPFINDLVLDLSPDGLTEGVWYYRVAAVMDSVDLDNPGGETLPSDTQPVRVPAGLPEPLEVTLHWTAVPGAAEYLVYRSPTADLVAGQEDLLAMVDGSTTSYTDTGVATDPEAVPLEVGDLGVWKPMASLGDRREGLGLGVGLDPDTGASWYLYAIGGRDGASALDTYEYLELDASTSHPPVGATWTSGGANTLRGGRWQLGAFVVDQRATTRVAPGETWIHAGAGVASNGTTTISQVDAARVSAGGALESWIAVDSITPAFAGYGFAAAANQLFVFGGQGASPSDTSSSAQLCGIGFACVAGPPDPPDLWNWNALGFTLRAARYLPGSAVGAAHIYLIGGETTGGAPTTSIESSVW